ncbi:hypothetical protein CAI16_12725 [Virgibacillus dokdonensis]|uniref:Uncharacterized protein n=1 Tax=Virgibacillus dokdonensis TaxID=302167 RepID=A0A3E0WNV4_9BACI|nr:hypothetical protein CAI16_12725 [Virgibacillus dokdonensis]
MYRDEDGENPLFAVKRELFNRTLLFLFYQGNYYRLSSRWIVATHRNNQGNYKKRKKVVYKI